MPTTVEHQITVAEERLRLAMLASDSEALDELISPDLIFTNHLGQVLGKQADLELHRSGVLKFYTLEPSETQVKASGQHAIVSVRMKLTGDYGDTQFSADLRFTRVWCRSAGDTWQIVAGHSSAVQA
jgi:ketosteroid isomerase-like protein